MSEATSNQPTAVPFVLPTAARSTSGHATHEQIRSLLSRLYPRPHVPEHRREQRYPFPYLIRITPVGADGRTPLSASIVVVGKHISEHGLGFYHVQPITFRQVVASIPVSGQIPSLHMLMDLTWCRFIREGWYDGGGRFLSEVDGPPPNARQS